MSTHSRFGWQFVLDFVFNINIRSKEHAKLNKYRVPPSINYMELYNDFVGSTHLNHVILLFLAKSSLDFISSFSVSLQVSRVLVASLIKWTLSVA